MAFTLLKFVRHTPASALRTYFHERDIHLDAAVDWSQGERNLAKALTSSIEQLPDALRQMVYAEFERVEQLASETGERAIASAFPNLAVATSQFEVMEGSHERCLWTLVNHEQVFRRAEEIHFSAYNRLTRIWDGFVGPKALEVDQSEQALEGFKSRVQRLFRHRDGSGRSIDIDVFRRWSNTDDDAQDELIQITGYLEGIPSSVVEFEQGKLDRRVQRPAFEMALTYDHTTGAIDVIAKGGKQIRAGIARIFLVTLLGVDEDQLASIPPLRQYDLSRLLRPPSFPTDRADGIESVEVVRLRLRPYSGGTGRFTIEGSRGAEASVYDHARNWFGARDPLQSGFAVEHARLAITSYPEHGARRGKRLYVEITGPNGCNLKDRTQQERLIGEKYLDRWGLVKAIGRGARSA
jgi:hypothetical protein